VSPIYQPNFQCEECGAILRMCATRFRPTSRKCGGTCHETAQSSDHDLEAMQNVWLSSLGKMPDDERLVLWRAHYRDRSRLAARDWNMRPAPATRYLCTAEALCRDAVVHRPIQSSRRSTGFSSLSFVSSVVIQR